jgi:hypothetical protein
MKDENASNQLLNWARNNEISTMNFNSLFCKKDVCTRYSEGKWLYSDTHHLSVDGAALTIPQFIAYLKEF